MSLGSEAWRGLSCGSEVLKERFGERRIIDADDLASIDLD
jgi:hypothetical protein